MKTYDVLMTPSDTGAWVLKSAANRLIAKQKYKRCLAMAAYWLTVSYHCIDDKHRQKADKRHCKWLQFAKNFEESK